MTAQGFGHPRRCYHRKPRGRADHVIDFCGWSMVGGRGIEPLTPSMSRKCSPAELTAPRGFGFTFGHRHGQVRRDRHSGTERSSSFRGAAVRPRTGIHNLDSCQRYSARILPNLWLWISGSAFGRPGMTARAGAAAPRGPQRRPLTSPGRRPCRRCSRRRAGSGTVVPAVRLRDRRRHARGGAAHARRSWRSSSSRTRWSSRTRSTSSSPRRSG